MFAKGVRERLARGHQGGFATDASGDELHAGLLALERAGGDVGPADALVALDTNARPATQVRLQTTPAPGTGPVDPLGDAGTRPTGGREGQGAVEVAAQRALVLVPEVPLSALAPSPWAGRGASRRSADGA